MQANRIDAGKQGQRGAIPRFALRPPNLANDVPIRGKGRYLIVQGNVTTMKQKGRYVDLDRQRAAHGIDIFCEQFCVRTGSVVNARTVENVDCATFWGISIMLENRNTQSLR